MAITTATNNKRQGAIIALAKIRRAKEIMRAFQRVSNNPKKI